MRNPKTRRAKPKKQRPATTMDGNLERALEAVRGAAAEWGFTFEDLVGRSSARSKARGAGAKSGQGAAKGKATTKGGTTTKGKVAAKGKMPPKYRNPENPSETWSGQGRRPAWFIAAEGRGIPLSQLAIGRAAAAPAKSGGSAATKGGAAAKGKTAAKGKKAAKGKMPPKYRNTANPSETWSGQGRRPGWLIEAEDRGIPRSRFEIGGAGTSAAAAPAKAAKTASKGKGKGKVSSTSKLPPKYRNPDNPSETWSGRARRPKWFLEAQRRGVPISKLTV